jgi:hypothetical protein
MLASWSSKLKLILILVATVGAFILGARVASTTTVVEKEVKGETVTIVQDRIVTVTRTVHSDGTVTETTKTEEKSKNKKKKETKTEPVVISKPKAKYAIGYVLRPKWPRGQNDLLPGPAISHGVSIGYNLLDPLWLKFGIIPSDKIYTLGLEVQF